MGLKNKKILITAGPTWVPIDSVRVISNIASGETGIILAEKLCRFGAKVTLLLGPTGICCLNKKIRLLRFRFFDELKEIIRKELRARKYKVVIHSAAVSDYKPVKSYSRKMRSGVRNWKINLVPTEKIIDLIKKIDKNIFLVGFKFEPCAKRALLLVKSRNLLSHSQADLVVANTVYEKNQYQAYISNNRMFYGPLSSKKDLATKLIKILGDSLCKN